MPHARVRHVADAFKKSLRYWPIVCLVGPRQVGKSTFLKSLSKYRCFSFDDAGLSELAKKAPSELLAPPCIFDEAQKAPGIFDAIKLNVDSEKRPGKFILTGSVRFSARTLIRESLTGRAKTVQMYPLTCAETLSLEFRNHWMPNQAFRRNEVKKASAFRVGRKDLSRFMSKGGMPAIFAARNSSEVTSYWNSLIESYIYRDLTLVLLKNPKPKVALAILQASAEILALGELPHFSRILKKTGGTRTTVARHLQALEDMMILQRLSHLDASEAKDIFMPFDSALFLTLLKIASPLHDAAIHSACLHITLLNEVLAHQQASGHIGSVKYAVSPQGELIHLITTDLKGANLYWKIEQEPVPHEYSLRFLNSLKKKYGGMGTVLSSAHSLYDLKQIRVLPWEAVL